MAFDAITESIAHFIGAFQMSHDEARMRAEYEAIRAERAAEEEEDALELGTARSEAPHEIGAFDPKLDYRPPDAPLPSHATPRPDAPDLPATAAAPDPLDLPRYDGPLDPGPGNPPAGPGVGIDIHIDIPPPASIIAVTAQSTHLIDDDVFGDVGAGHFAPIAPATETLARLAQLAEDLSPVRLGADAAADWFGALDALRLALPDDVRVTDGPLDLAIATGDAARDTVFVNGERVDDLPDWTEFRPAFFTRDDVAEDDPDAHDFSEDFAPDAGDPFEDAAGHEVVAGANTSINQVSLTSNWLDAPVIAVAGSVLNLDVISQVNVLVEHDRLPEGTTSAPSTATNVARIETTATTPGAASTATGGDGPEAWGVVRIEGDVTQINWVDQYTFATDHDRAEVSFSGSSTYLGLGGNESLNDVSLWELGFTYDLILVGGNMIDASVVNQVNVLLDSDEVVADGSAAVPPAKAESAGMATDGQAEDRIATSGVPKDQRGDDEDDAPRLDGPATEADPGEAAPDGWVSGGDNMLWNEARIDNTGADTTAPLDAAFKATLDRLAGGAETIGADIAANPLFDGIELLRVLYISGDLVTVDQINQTNVFGDADQVHLARENFAQNLHDQITVTTGSNLMANFASIADRGVDSKVMAGGEAYSDALIHQAGLIDTDPTMPGGPDALASEAVAFLADDMMDMPSVEDISAMTDTMIAETAGQSDLMQTLLS